MDKIKKLGILLISIVIITILFIVNGKVSKNKLIEKNKEIVASQKEEIVTEFKNLDTKSDNTATYVFNLGDKLDLKIESRDNIILKTIDKTTGQVITEINKAYGNYLIKDNEKFGRDDNITPGKYSIKLGREELGYNDIENIAINLSVIKDGNEIYNHTYPEDFVKVDVRQVPVNPNDFGKLYNFKLQNNRPTTAQVEIIAYGNGHDKLLKEVHKQNLNMNPNEEKIISIPSNIGVKEIKVITRVSDLYNEEKLSIDSSYIKLGEDGHIGVRSISPNPADIGVKYKWEISNLNNMVRSNVKITTKDEKEVLATLDLNIDEVIEIDTLVEKGDSIKIHSMQGDGSYVSKVVSVNKDMIKFGDVKVENVNVDPNSYGKMLRWKVVNPYSSGRANVIVRDGAGNVLSQFDLDYNVEKLVDVDVNKGREIIVETRMGNGKYSAKRYGVVKDYDKQFVKVNKLGVVDGVCRYEIENVLGVRTSVIVSTEDESTVIDSFELGAGEKKVIEVNDKYIKDIKVKTMQFDGRYY